MLSIEKKINGKLISRAEVLNLHPIGDGKYLYHVEYVQFDRKQNKLNFEVIHDREDGAEELTFLIYQEVVRRLK